MVGSVSGQREVGPLVMGVLNVTPDSFSDGGAHRSERDAIARGLAMATEGAAIIDVGGESTRPGAAPVSTDDEIARVEPVVAGLVRRLDGAARVSVDTRSPEVARAAVAAGASLINDVSARLWPVAAELGVGWVAVHGCDDPRTMQDDPRYDDVVAEVVAFLDDVARTATAAGVGEVWVDPGFGFAKTPEHNLDVLTHLDALVATGWPVVVGTSRKSTLGLLLAAADATSSPPPTDDRLEASVATAVWAFDQGAAMVRAHDVLATVQAALVVAGSVPPLPPASP
jgi:dihydropteroate synthase